MLARYFLCGPLVEQAGLRLNRRSVRSCICRLFIVILTAKIPIHYLPDKFIIFLIILISSEHRKYTLKIFLENLILENKC